MSNGSKKIYKRLVDFFSSLKLAILLLILLAAVSVLGTLVPQEQDPAMYVERYGPDTYGYLRAAGLIDLYHSWGFRLLMSLITVNLLVCTLRRFRGVLGRTCGPEAEKMPESIARMKLNNELPSPGSVSILERALTDKGYTLLKRGRFIYGTKGRIGAWGDMVTHFSILMVILGAIVGSLGFISTVNVYVGGSTDVAYNWTTGRDEPLGFTLYVDNFSRKFYSSAMKVSVREWSTGRNVGVFDVRDGGAFRIPGTAITVSPDMVDTVRREVLLNLYVEGTPIGRFDTGDPAGSRDLIPGINYMFSLESFDMPAVKSILSTIRIVRDGRMVKQGVIGVNSPLRFEGLTVYQTSYGETEDGRGYTGYQIVKDPGVPLVWAGFVFIMVGLFISFYFYHRQVWIYVGDKSISLGGTTNKNWEGFMREYGGLIKSFMREVEP